MDCRLTASTLNGLHRLYEDTMDKDKPYMIHLVKQRYFEFLELALKQFTLIPLDTLENCEQLLGPLPILQSLINHKNNAVHNSEFENAAEFRNQQREYIEFRIHVSGRKKEDHFFWRDEKIFYKTW